MYLPKLRNLSLRDNDIDSLSDISSFFTRNRSAGLRQLQEIWLVGNPLVTKYEKSNDMDQYY
jgi:nuclear RNA export factor